MAHRYDSWGRTRRPKNVAGPDGTAITSVASLAHAKTITDNCPNVAKDVPKFGVYSTENQRFLHLASTGSGTVANVWVYHYASQMWAELVDSSNNTITLEANEAKIVEIDGADLVAFKLTDATSVFAACSTF